LKHLVLWIIITTLFVTPLFDPNSACNRDLEMNVFDRNTKLSELTDPENLQCYWPGDNNPDDVINGNNFDLVNGASYSPSSYDHSFDFNGDQQYGITPHSSFFDFNLSDFAINFWINYNSLEGEQVLIEKWIQSEVAGWTLTSFPTDPSLRFATSEDGHERDLDVFIDEIETNIWYFVQVVRLGGLVQIYWDSILLGEMERPYNFDLHTPLIIGSREGSSHFLNGKIDEIKIYVDKPIDEPENQEATTEITHGPLI
jgi:hypothetical protein